MRITTRTRYAIRALYDLAFHRLGQAAGAKEIADRQKVPLRFLEQILQDLRKAGIVEARRGPRGGYALARPPAQITLAEVLYAVRGPLEEMFGFDAPANGNGTGNGDDVPAAVWTDVRARLVDVLARATLQDFVTRAEAAGVKRAALPATMYFI
ncbi:MAG TPA: Rrf2 family transcriptional regulator [Polyangia bacterium]|jgi:Rrf2 family protein|nr:Rrf2 family transcriptional regulator [Polyangia bacterium]